jgi:hypothetical protein
MFTRRLVLFFSAFCLAPAFGEEGEGRGERRRGRRRHRWGHRHFYDQEVARRALQEGRARPLAEILAKAKESIRGDVIGVDLEEQDGAMVYELKVLRPDGELAEIRVDALTGAVLRQDGD